MVWPEQCSIALLELPEELLQCVAKHGSARGLASMLSVCRRTHFALCEAMCSTEMDHWEEAWRRFAFADFPRLKTLLQLAPPSCSMREIYYKQRLASRPPAEPHVALEDFIFTAELQRGEQSLASWSGVPVAHDLHTEAGGHARRVGSSGC